MQQRFYLPSLSRLALCLVTFLALLTGCAPSSPSGGPIVLRIWYSTDDPVERTWSHELASQFERTHPAVQVRMVDYSFEDLNTKLQLALQAGTPPDLAYVTPRGPGIPAYLGAHKLRDLTTAARSGSWTARLRPGLLAAYNQPFGFMGARHGAVVAVPTSLAAVGVLYNKGVLARLHLRLPSSMAAFERALRSAKAAGYTPIGMGNADGWLGDDWYLTLVNALASPQQLAPEFSLSHHFSFRQQPFVQAAATLQRWSRRGYFTQDFGGLDAQEGIDQFFHGRTLFQLISSSENSQIQQDQEQTGLPIGVFAFPDIHGSGIIPLSGYLGWVVPRAGRHPRQAIAFINSLLMPATTRLLVRHGVLPAATPAMGPKPGTGWQQEYFRALDTARPGVYLDAAPVANLNATMEANVQLLLQGYEGSDFLVKSLQEDYTSHKGSTARIDGEF
ncbi:MAG: extracellular solute-binding protein [Chloroflexota bacterium]|nr:extracellular solute-binding protein [Chloroflexota bacterium]